MRFLLRALSPWRQLSPMFHRGESPFRMKLDKMAIIRLQSGFVRF